MDPLLNAVFVQSGKPYRYEMPCENVKLYYEAPPDFHGSDYVEYGLLVYGTV
jgi:hypothetical protein